MWTVIVWTRFRGRTGSVPNETPTKLTTNATCPIETRRYTRLLGKLLHATYTRVFVLLIHLISFWRAFVFWTGQYQYLPRLVCDYVRVLIQKFIKIILYESTRLLDELFSKEMRNPLVFIEWLVNTELFLNSRDMRFNSFDNHCSISYAPKLF